MVLVVAKRIEKSNEQLISPYVHVTEATIARRTIQKTRNKYSFKITKSTKTIMYNPMSHVGCPLHKHLVQNTINILRTKLR